VKVFRCRGRAPPARKPGSSVVPDGGSTRRSRCNHEEDSDRAGVDMRPRRPGVSRRGYPRVRASPIGSAGAPPSRAILRTPRSRGQRSPILLPGRPRLGVTPNCAAERRTASRHWYELSTHSGSPDAASIKPNLVLAACPFGLQKFSQIWRASLVSVSTRHNNAGGVGCMPARGSAWVLI
jgi:hypothetical protein